MTFTKLFSSITASTVWCESMATRIVWITLLAMADRRGRIYASIPGLANMARVPLEDTERAIERFLAPDKYSRTPDHDGRRIEPIDGGWRLLNHAKYRDIRDAEARREYQRDWDRDNRPNRHKKSDLSESDRNRPQPTQAEAEADTEKSRAERSRGSRLPPDWKPTEEQVAWARKERPDIDPLKAADTFRDHWVSVAGSRGVKLDWDATWRNWVRKELARSAAGSAGAQRKEQRCGNCRKTISGGWTQSPKGPVCDECHRGYMGKGWPAQASA